MTDKQYRNIPDRPDTAALANASRHAAGPTKLLQSRQLHSYYALSPL
jgi:hypothetical protein